MICSCPRLAAVSAARASTTFVTPEKGITTVCGNAAITVERLAMTDRISAIGGAKRDGRAFAKSCLA